MIWRLAWRNLWRNRTRTIIMTSAVGFTYALMLISFGIGDDSHRRMLQEATKAAGGDVIVHGDGYWASRASDIVIDDAQHVLATVSETDLVGSVVPRIFINGLVATSASARPVFLQGVDPNAETGVTDVASDIIQGTFLQEDRDDPLILGSRIVEELEVEIGDRVVLTASRPDGELTRALFHLTGVLQTGSREVDGMIGYTTLDAARRAVNMDNQLTQLGILGVQGADGEQVAAAVRARLGSDGNALEVLAWRDAVPEMVGFIELDDAFGYIYLGVILLVVLFSITNTFLMAVMERVREFGLLSALGVRGERIGRLLLSETVLMTGIAMVGGLLLGVAAHLAVSHWGISIAIWGLEDLDVEISGIDIADLVIYSTIVPTKWVIGSILVAIATISSAVYPAWRASRLAPAEAMRFYE